MDQLLSQLVPTHRIGDSFNWWVGQVEETTADSNENKGGYRLKVRIVGDHPSSKELLPTEDLPWAQVMMPVNVPFMPGNIGGANHQLIKGCWVVGFYFDTDKQKPIVMGSIGQTPSATVRVTETRPGDGRAFTNTTSSDKNPNYPPTDGTPGDGVENPNKVTGALPDGTRNEKGEQKVEVPDRKRAGILDEKWCQTVAEKCDKPDIKEQMKIILGELLFEIQRNNGNIGSYLVGQVNGKISDITNIGRSKIAKAQKVLREFIARVKGFVIQKITAGVKDLIKMLIAPSDVGNILTPVTEWFNRMLKDLGCKMADLGERLEKWLTNVIMSYITQIYQNAACLLDTFVNGILSQFNSLMEEMLGSILGPLQDILGVVGSALNLLGGAVNFVLQLLGISCSGPASDCAKYKKICNTGEKEKRDDDEDFLDKLLEDIDNLFPVTTGDYTQYTCPAAYEGKPITNTNVGFTGGVPLGPEEPGQPVPPGTASKKKKITYDIADIFVEEGNEAVFTVTRNGYIDRPSSLTYKTLSKKGTATEDVDYLPVNDILGFASGETQKKIIIKTFFSSEQEPNEDFFIKLGINSPVADPEVESSFIKNVAKCTITEGEVVDPLNPKPPLGEVNPITGISETFPPSEGEVPDEGDSGGGGVGVTPPSGGEDAAASPTFRVSADRSSVKEGEFIKYTITTTNVVNGATLKYTLTGTDITSDDIIGSEIRGKFVINNNTASVTVGIAEDGVVEDEEVLRFTIDSTGAFVDVLIVSDDGKAADDTSEFDEGEGETPENTYDEFTPPTVDPGKVITDPAGGIIEIPIDDPGDPWAEPPYVFIGGEGIGAIATPLLDERGFITEIRVKSPGYGYKLNLASDNNVRCIIDTFTIISPGRGYKDKPDIYVNGELGVAEAIINDDGFVIGGRVLDRSLTFDELPQIIVVGGGGYGATMIPSLVCRETDQLELLGATKIGTGRYVDCP